MAQVGNAEGAFGHLKASTVRYLILWLLEDLTSEGAAHLRLDKIAESILVARYTALNASSIALQPKCNIRMIILVYFKFIVIALNSLLISVFLGVSIPMIITERSLLPLLFLLIITPFAMLVVYAFFWRSLLIWWISLVGNFLMAFGVGCFVLSLGQLIGGSDSSMGAMMFDQLLFVGALAVLNVFYLFRNRHR